MAKESLNKEQIKALKDFRKTIGRFWKSILMECWSDGVYDKYNVNKEDIPHLQQIRNKDIDLSKLKL